MSDARESAAATSTRCQPFDSGCQRAATTATNKEKSANRTATAMCQKIPLRSWPKLTGSWRADAACSCAHSANKNCLYTEIYRPEGRSVRNAEHGYDAVYRVGVRLLLDGPLDHTHTCPATATSADQHAHHTAPGDGGIAAVDSHSRASTSQRTYRRSLCHSTTKSRCGVPHPYSALLHTILRHENGGRPHRHVRAYTPVTPHGTIAVPHAPMYLNGLPSSTRACTASSQMLFTHVGTIALSKATSFRCPSMICSGHGQREPHTCADARPQQSWRSPHLSRMRRKRSPHAARYAQPQHRGTTQAHTLDTNGSTSSATNAVCRHTPSGDASHYGIKQSPALERRGRGTRPRTSSDECRSSMSAALTHRPAVCPPACNAATCNASPPLPCAAAECTAPHDVAPRSASAAPTTDRAGSI